MIDCVVRRSKLDLYRKNVTDHPRSFMNDSIDTLLQQGFIQATAQLANFARQDNWLTNLQIAFGSNFDTDVALKIASQFQAGDFTLLPKIQILTEGELGRANGAYARELDRILVSSDFLAQMDGDVNAVAELLIEEIGHKLDCVLNGTEDSPGDEGAIFLILVTGHPLSAETLAALRATEDRGVVNIDGRQVAIEKQDFWPFEGDNAESRAAFSDFLDWYLRD
jgi:hypothetical protein